MPPSGFAPPRLLWEWHEKRCPYSPSLPLQAPLSSPLYHHSCLFTRSRTCCAKYSGWLCSPFARFVLAVVSADDLTVFYLFPPEFDIAWISAWYVYLFLSLLLLHLNMCIFSFFYTERVCINTCLMTMIRSKNDRRALSPPMLTNH